MLNQLLKKNTTTANKAAVDAKAQVSTVTLSETGALDQGDVIKVTIGGKLYEHTVEANATLTSVIDALVDAINVEGAVITASNDDGVLNADRSG